MSREVFLSIVTPTYNRKNDLEKLYASLIGQSSHNFIWLIIDDGSTDGTSDIVKTFKNEKFEIEYYFKENGGKHTAHNYALDYINSELTMIVDSDDYLLENAVEDIYLEWSMIKDSHNDLCGISFLKIDQNQNISGKPFSEYRIKDNFINMRINRNDISEKAEVWKSSILKKYPFPVFPNENYVGEGSIWCSIAKEYDMYFVNKAIYVFEYQEEGLTKSGRKLRLKNLKGGMYSSQVFMDPKFKLEMRIKKMILYIAYGKLDNQSFLKMYTDTKMKLLYLIFYPIGKMLSTFWTYKYLNKQ